ncbi:MAG: transglutaminase family protein [Planctomycetota bacterium]
MARLPALLPLLLALLPACLASPARAQSFPIQKFDPTPDELRQVLWDEWYGAYYRGEKCGYSQMRLAFEGDSFVFERNVKWKILSMGHRQEVVTRERYEFAAKRPYPLMAARYFQRGDKDKIEVEARREGTSFRVTLKNPNGEQTQVKQALPYTFLDAAGRYFATRPEAGGKLMVIQLDLAKWQGGALLYEVVDSKRVNRRGVPTKLFRCKLKTMKDQKLVGEAVLDERGVIMKEHIFGLVELRLEPEELAKQADYSSDLFEGGMAKLDRPLGCEARSVRSLRLQVGGKARKSIQSYGPQVVEHDEGKTFVEIVAGRRNEPASAAERKKAMEVTAEVPWQHPKVAALAREAVAGARTPREKVVKLVPFVSRYVQDAYGKNAVSALQVIESKQGDCTEHSTLFAALARAAGVPCRMVFGVAYTDDSDQAFGGHAWNEVELDGQWVAVDSTWEETLVDATHIRFGTSDAETARILGRLKFRLVSVEK